MRFLFLTLAGLLPLMLVAQHANHVDDANKQSLEWASPVLAAAAELLLGNEEEGV